MQVTTRTAALSRFRYSSFVAIAAMIAVAAHAPALAMDPWIPPDIASTGPADLRSQVSDVWQSYRRHVRHQLQVAHTRYHDPEVRRNEDIVKDYEKARWNFIKAQYDPLFNYSNAAKAASQREYRSIKWSGGGAGTSYASYGTFPAGTYGTIIQPWDQTVTQTDMALSFYSYGGQEYFSGTHWTMYAGGPGHQPNGYLRYTPLANKYGEASYAEKFVHYSKENPHKDVWIPGRVRAVYFEDGNVEKPGTAVFDRENVIAIGKSQIPMGETSFFPPALERSDRPFGGDRNARPGAAGWPSNIGGTHLHRNRFGFFR